MSAKPWRWTLDAQSKMRKKCDVWSRIQVTRIGVQQLSGESRLFWLYCLFCSSYAILIFKLCIESNSAFKTSPCDPELRETLHPSVVRLARTPLHLATMFFLVPSNTRMLARSSWRATYTELHTGTVATSRSFYPAPSRCASPAHCCHSRAIKSIRLFSQYEYTRTLLDRHGRAVEEISTTVRRFYERKEKFRISHGSTNST